MPPYDGSGFVAADAMTVRLDPILQSAAEFLANRAGVTPEALVLETLRKAFAVLAPAYEPQNQRDWNRLRFGVPTGPSRTDRQFSREEMYD